MAEYEYHSSRSDHPFRTPMTDKEAIAVFATLIFGLVFLLIAAYWKPIWSSLTLGLSLWGVRLVVTTVVLASSAFLFWMKYKSPYFYAGLELSFATVTAWTAAGNIEKDPLNLGVIAAAAYLTVRGLDNWKRAREEARKKLKLPGNNQSPADTNPADSPSAPQS